MLEILKPLRNFFRVFCICILAILLLPISFLIFLIMFPHIIYRKSLAYLAPILKPELAKIINLSGMAYPGFHKDPKYSAVVYEMEIEGEIELDQFREDFSERILEKKNAKGDFVYPEFKQNIVLWKGHLFFKNYEGFKVEEHIKPWVKLGLTNTGNNSEEVNRIRKEISLEVFVPDKPYWIIYTLFNAESQKTLLFLKQHHSYFDGVSNVYLFMNFLNCKFPELKSMPKTNEKISKTILKKILESAKVILKIWRAFYISAENLIYSWKSHHEWKKPISSRKFFKTERVEDMRSQILHIPFANLRQASNMNQVNVSSVVFAGISGGIRRYLLKNDLKFDGNPILGLATPRCNHPIDKLRNHVYGTYLPTQMCNPDPGERLQLIYQSWEKIKNSYYSDFIWFIYILLFMNLPLSRIQHYHKRMMTNPFLVFYSGLACPKEKLFWRGKEFKFVAFYPMLYTYSLGIPILIHSMSNREGIDFFIHGGFPSEDSIRELSSYIDAEVDELINISKEEIV